MEIKTNTTYVGELEIKSFSDNLYNTIEIHNSSTALMSRLFAEALVHGKTSITPTFLDLGEVVNNNFISCLTAPVSVTAPIITTDNGRYMTTYKAVVTNKNLTSGTHTGTAQLKLLDGSKNPLAVSNLVSGGQAITIDSVIDTSKSLQVNWKLKLVDNED